MMINKKYYFISGLPRSGSTLLSAILKQNPNFYADISSPLQQILEASIDHMSLCDTSQNISNAQRENVLYAIIEGYYKHIDKNIIFDTSRIWSSNTSLIKSLFPYSKIICCVRDIVWILDSFEKFIANNPYYKNNFNGSEGCVETRCDMLMDVKKSGQVIKPWFWLKEGLALNEKIIYLVEYEELCRNPKKTINAIYDFIEQPHFTHNFENIKYSNDLFDLKIGSPNLHKIESKVEFKPRKSILPDSVIEKYKNMEFWRKNKIKLNYE